MRSPKKDRLFVDPQALIIEDDDRVKEAALTAKIGSTGQGVWVATARKVLWPLADPPIRLAGMVLELGRYIRSTLHVVEDAFYRRDESYSKRLKGLAPGVGASLRLVA